MLSKLLYELNKEEGFEYNINLNLIISSLTWELEKKYKSVKIESFKPGGTLGLFFNAILDGEKIFIKTHLPEKIHRNNLIKETKILKILYDKVMYVNELEIEICNKNQNFLIMSYLEPLKKNPEPFIVKNLIKQYSEKLNVVFKNIKLLKDMHSFKYILEQGKIALKELTFLRLINIDISNKCSQYLSVLELHYDLGCETICHGDLSNKNIMNFNDNLIIIDWEDAFIGFLDYDFYFWLTFFDQRKYYNKNLFESYGIDHSKCKILMVLITILKCLLSYKNGSYMNNTLSINDRICEIIDL